VRFVDRLRWSMFIFGYSESTKDIKNIQIRLVLMQLHTGRSKFFQVCGIVALYVLIVILPVSAAGIAPVTNPGVLPDTQRGHFALPVDLGGY